MSGDDKADALDKGGREQHPNNKSRRSEEPVCLDPAWERLGVHPMHSDVSSSMGSAMTRLSGTPLWVAEGYNIDVKFDTLAQR